MNFTKIVIVIVLIAIVASLASAMRFMLTDRGQGNRTVRALTVRIGLSVALFLLLFVAWRLGWIQPHGLRQ